MVRREQVESELRIIKDKIFEFKDNLPDGFIPTSCLMCASIDLDMKNDCFLLYNRGKRISRQYNTQRHEDCPICKQNWCSMEDKNTRFGMLTVNFIIESEYHCVCDCETRIIVTAAQLGEGSNCGCVIAAFYWVMPGLLTMITPSSHGNKSKNLYRRDWALIMKKQMEGANHLPAKRVPFRILLRKIFGHHHAGDSRNSPRRWLHRLV